MHAIKMKMTWSDYIPTYAMYKITLFDGKKYKQYCVVKYHIILIYIFWGVKFGYILISEMAWESAF